MNEWARTGWMGKKVRVIFAPHWPVPIGNYTYEGFDDEGLYVTHADGHGRHILWYDIERVELKDA